ncbi:5-oxoprolinase subunit PxpB [Microbulbifer mangrovi]|uniref:5-oxoprolinase subunit PxpB n=1 Tax=Microbulbifer mangrovi TaxID=927787 RepID=UPI0009904412|nr:5-oxoprolinase subunit PxpB [Microbulbifer mangrovi]
MLTGPGFELRTNGDAALDIRFAADPSEMLSEHIIALAEAIESCEQLPSITELVPAYQCLTVCYDPLRLPRCEAGAPDTALLEQKLLTLTEQVLAQSVPARGTHHLIRIPVCYDEKYAPDMQVLCESSGLTADEIIRRHTAPHYLVHMLGFTPGFLYLGGLEESLHCPRKARPELQVPAGSVGIGGAQTGIYPQATPGGWQLIGRTPLALFRPLQEPAFIARPLDRIQFVAISAAEFSAIDPMSPPEKVPLVSDSNSGDGR